MTRPRLLLLIVAVCLAIVLVAMAWVSWVVFDLDRRDAHAQRAAEWEENIRLALWRVDSALGPILAQENMRPYYEFDAFYTPAFAFDLSKPSTAPARVVVPSPLLLTPTPFIKVHFQIDPAGRFSSPQIPSGNVPESLSERLQKLAGSTAARPALDTLAAIVDRESLLAHTPQPDTDTSERSLKQKTVEAVESEQVAAGVQEWLRDLNASNQQRQAAMPLAKRKGGRGRNEPAQQELRSNVEYQQRLEATAQNAIISKFNRDANSAVPPDASSLGTAKTEAALARKSLFTVPANVFLGDTKPMWIAGNLILSRQVVIDGQTWLQGCWLDWEAIRSWLLERITDLLPHAALHPVTLSAPQADRQIPYHLAMLPVALDPGTLRGSEEPLSAPIRNSLIVAWVCTLLAAAAVVLLVVGMAALSERRAAFVSAVTHELRTPLTTFRMYAEMLAGGMVTDPQRRQQYLSTLQAESNRLAQLVENVLSYARLERRRAGVHRQRIAAGEMIDRFADRLHQRAAQAEMECVIELDGYARDTPLLTDVSAVEQIVFNLVDNACKYAAPANDRRIHLRAEADAKELRLSIVDHGPGIDADVAGRLFSPFSKSAKAAANSAPGVGLGLALSRRLARQLGGHLRLTRSDDNGCRFDLTLPRDRENEEHKEVSVPLQDGHAGSSVNTE